MNRGEKFQVRFGLNVIGWELMRQLKNNNNNNNQDKAKPKHNTQKLKANKQNWQRQTPNNFRKYWTVWFV